MGSSFQRGLSPWKTNSVALAQGEEEHGGRTWWREAAQLMRLPVEIRALITACKSYLSLNLAASRTMLLAHDEYLGVFQKQTIMKFYSTNIIK